MAHPDPGQPPGEFGTLIGGMHCTPALIAHEGAQSGIQVALRPLGARALLGLPAANSPTSTCPRRPSSAASAPNCATGPGRGGWPERFAVLDEILLRRLGAGAAGEGRRSRPGVASVAVCGRRRARVGARGRDGLERAHLTSRFRAEIGLTPKAAARVIRFDRARHLLVSQLAVVGSDTRLADLAVACGYFDQAHLAREFRSLAGCPPSQWLAEEFRNVQAGAWLTEGAWEDRTGTAGAGKG